MTESISQAVIFWRTSTKHFGQTSLADQDRVHTHRSSVILRGLSCSLLLILPAVKIQHPVINNPLILISMPLMHYKSLHCIEDGQCTATETRADACHTATEHSEERSERQVAYQDQRMSLARSLAPNGETACPGPTPPVQVGSEPRFKCIIH